MCILCVVQRWSRRVATMLPWLVIPLIILWALSQLLPPALRFEITSPRLACVLVLLATLFWYEILMPHLSSWRARRSARLRERRRTEALELQKLRKTATRRCRNCNMPYRDQNPGGGRFMCSYCGHISRRPALDLPDQIESTGMFPDVVGKNGWLCYADGHGNWVGPSPKHWTDGEHQCLAERSDSGLSLVACKLLFYFVSSARWLHGNFLRFGSAREDVSSDSDHKGLSGKGVDGVNFHESRGEKARRKAEEKRQARLEKEMLEEEERKQREEVARLVEERRRLRDEMLAAEAERLKGSTVNSDRDGRKEMNMKKNDRRKDKDKASSKSNSDGEELDRRFSREIERNHEFEKKAENEWRDLHKGTLSSKKSHALTGVYGSKVGGNNSRYFDRVKGSFLYTSKGFGGPFFGRNIQNTSTVTKPIKHTSGYIDHSQNSVNKRDAHFVVHAVGKPTSGAGGKASVANLTERAATNVQPKETNVKKSWQQLFIRSSVVSPDPDANYTLQGNPAEHEHLAYRVHQPFNKNSLSSYSTTDNQVDCVKSLPITTYPPANNSIYHNLPDAPFSPLEETSRSSVSEDADFFEDPCYVPDPTSLLGPVSESIDNFPSNLETGFSERKKCEGSSYLMNVLTSADVNKPSPIEPPLPRLHFPEGKHFTSDKLFSTPNSDISSNILGQSTWQMWGSPLSQEGLGLIGRPSNWFSPLVQCNSQQQDMLHSLPHKPIGQPISKNNNALPGLSTQHAHIAIHERTCGTYSPLSPGFVDNGIWQQKPPFQSSPRVDGDDHLLPLDLMDNISQNEAPYTSPMKSTTMHSFGTEPAISWSREVFDEAGDQSNGGENTGSFFSRGPDVPSVWSFT